ncbi:protein of unknown function [Methylacidimicrobium sp. AP8]|uniref:hypothetical protein n=1 Tax=Methylacidimicrobium sp. AP8 TaxID=2730359 RepID=UPI0018C08CCA|nr:hypothetical protein [Methylacidimicrobium sp. AP8]CAB4242732.1 protein of unknown function [Methylacidimicrobium sp. AP8]
MRDRQTVSAPIDRLPPDPAIVALVLFRHFRRKPASFPLATEAAATYGEPPLSSWGRKMHLGRPAGLYTPFRVFGLPALQVSGRTRDRQPVRRRRFPVAAPGMTLSLLLLLLPVASTDLHGEEEPKEHPDAGLPEERQFPAPVEPPDAAPPQAEDPKPIPVKTGMARVQRAFRSSPPDRTWKRITR